MSIVGIRSSSPAPRISRLPAESEPPTSYSRPRETAPSSISDAFAVVPPMSKAIAFSIAEPLRDPERRDDAGGRARLEREDGPQRRVSEVITPPDDCMIVSGASHARAVEPAPDLGDVATPSAAGRRR